MLDRARILALIPHQGAMCLLDTMMSWDREHIVCGSRSHLDPAHPLRRDGRLGAVCGVEYGLQAAALHGALCAGGVPQPAGYVAALRGVEFDVTRLDDPAFGALRIEADLEASSPAGLIYAFRVLAASGASLLAGRGTVMLPRAA
jgi:predicted hotdog family 3-hydroxylacyl-ACP dehydratase